MKKIILIVCILLLMHSSPVLANYILEADQLIQVEQQLLKEKQNEIIVLYQNSLSKKATLSQPSQAQIKERGWVSPNVEIIKIKENTVVEDVLKELRQDKCVRFAELNKVYLLEDGSLPEANSILSVVNDQYYYKQWGFETIMAPQAWDIITDVKKEVVVAVIDTGIQLEHEDLKNRIAPGGYNFILNNNKVYDLNGHGTTVSGVIAAEANNYKGIAGVTGTLDVTVLPLQAGYSDGTLYLSDVIRAIEYAIDYKVDIINMSFGSTGFSNIEQSAIQNAINNGIVVVAAAGNDGDSTYMYPASYDNVFAVGAISQDRLVSSFSNHHDKVDFVAPGELIYTTDIQNTYKYVSGTSYATPFISGIAATMKAVKPSLTVEEIYAVMAATADDQEPPGKDPYYGYGIVNAYKAIDKLVANTYEQTVIYVGNLGFLADAMLNDSNYKQSFNDYFGAHLQDDLIVSLYLGGGESIVFDANAYLNAIGYANVVEFSLEHPAVIPEQAKIWSQ